MPLFSFACCTALLIAAGCSLHSRPATSPDRTSIESLNAQANDATASPDDRCRAIFTLFKNHIKPGSTPDEIHAVLTDASWLKRSEIRGIYILLGWIPVTTDRGGTAFEFSVLPEIMPSTGRPPNCGYHIYVSLTGVESEESAYAILTGRKTNDTEAVLKEFALCYPDGKIDVVTESGIETIDMSN